MEGECPECGRDLSGDEKFCPGCGCDLASVHPSNCPECGYDLSGDERYCPGCGHNLDQPASSTTAVSDSGTDRRDILKYGAGFMSAAALAGGGWWLTIGDSSASDESSQPTAQQETPMPTAMSTARSATSTPTPTSTPAGEFRYTFETGPQGWTFGKRRDERASEGTGAWSEEYGGSLRLHVEGAPSTIQAWKQVGPLSKGTTVTAHYDPKRFAYAEAGLFLQVVVPNDEVLRLDGENDQESGGYEQDGILTGELPRDLPPETELEIKLVIWPGETTVWIRDVIGK